MILPNLSQGLCKSCEESNQAPCVYLGHWILYLVGLLVIVGVTADTFAQDESVPLPTDSDRVDFASEVQPIFQAKCYSCHGPNKQESNYRLDVKRRALEGGDFGAEPMVAGRSDESDLVAYVSGEDPRISQTTGSLFNS